MKSVVRYFFRTLRVLLGPVMLLKEALTRPQGVVRTSAEQASVDAACRGLALYQYKTCPFCIKTRQEMRRLSLDIAKVDAQHAGPARTELLQGDEAGNSHWLYDSEKIIAYLRSRFAPA